MKKFFSPILPISFILCAFFLAMNFSAAEDSGEALRVLRTSLEKTSAANYLEIRGAHRTEKTIAGETKAERIFARVRYVVPERGKEQFEIMYWDEDAQITSLYYAKNGYHYDAIARTREVSNNVEPIEDMLQVILHSDFKNDVKNISMKKIPDGYEIRFQIPTPYDSSVCTMQISEDETIRAIRWSHRYADGLFASKITERYTLTVNEPFDIGFPADLGSYRLVTYPVN